MTGTEAGTRPIRVLIVDDDESVRGLVARVIDEQNDMLLVGEAANGETGVAVARRVLPDVVVMDGTMPVMGGVEATRLILALLPDTQVVAFSSVPAKAEDLLAAGAVAAVEKSGSLDNLVAAVRLAGGRSLAGQA
jgi:two-component system invasion response regulator UvrY